MYLKAFPFIYSLVGISREKRLISSQISSEKEKNKSIQEKEKLKVDLARLCTEPPVAPPEAAGSTDPLGCPFPVAAQRENFWIRAPAKVAFLGFLIAFPSRLYTVRVKDLNSDSGPSKVLNKVLHVLHRSGVGRVILSGLSLAEPWGPAPDP